MLLVGENCLCKLALVFLTLSWGHLARMASLLAFLLPLPLSPSLSQQDTHKSSERRELTKLTKTYSPLSLWRESSNQHIFSRGTWKSQITTVSGETAKKFNRVPTDRVRTTEQYYTPVTQSPAGGGWLRHQAFLSSFFAWFGSTACFSASNSC